MAARIDIVSDAYLLVHEGRLRLFEPIEGIRGLWIACFVRMDQK